MAERTRRASVIAVFACRPRDRTVVVARNFSHPKTTINPRRDASRERAGERMRERAIYNQLSPSAA
jgi:hypothetical protein